MKIRNGFGAGDTDLPLTARGRVDGRSARKVETRRRIIQAASELFAEQGYTGTSMDQIAKSAGVSKGTIFYNYKNKADLFEHLISEFAAAIADQIEMARQGRRGWEALSEGTITVLRAADSAPAPAQIIVTELFRLQRPWSDSLAAAREVLMQPLLEIMEELAEDRARVVGSKPMTSGNLRNVTTPLLGALVVAALDRRAYNPSLPLESVHEVLMSAISGLQV
ncbi:MAG: TetR/AcrR family transcriptional regulator [Luteococcus sp.]|uniref:TetR/AcrR family transcriptional regulator n=1 Tax=Luteococcus sp. TaxID=1969402 RepID=UPI002647A970|nr:TetR/AcrR family transcriptional regulator [Luteococcus sp.]MDN5562898.1 TetR/AcrR family transcriptional regulator [Luteococcus sp.]